MSEYRLYKVIRTDGQQYFDIEYVRDVVTCKDCRFSKVYQTDSSGVEGRFCEAFTQVRMVTDDDFCSYGERKDNE